MPESLLGLVTFSGRQSATSLKSARGELLRHGVDYRLFHLTHKFTRRFWKHWRSPLEDLRCAMSLLLQPYDFLLLNPGSELMRRPMLLRVLLLTARFRKIRTYVRWGSCAWLLENKKNRQVGPRRFEALSRLISRPGIYHLTLTPQSARDLARATGITRSFLIYNCNKLPDRYDKPAPPSDPPFVVNVASVQARKGPDLFIDVAEEVCRQHPTVRFVWVGGRATEELAGVIRKRGLEGRVEFVGYVAPPYEWIQRASLVLFPSRSEAFGLTVAEAMACYRTVCCFKGTGPEFVVGDTGIVVPQFDVSVAAERIVERLLRPPAERINLCAYDRYEALFSPGPFAERLSEILSAPQLAEGKHGFVADLSSDGESR